MKQFTYKCEGFCGQKERKSFNAENVEEADNMLSEAPSSVKPYSTARLINVTELDT